MEALLTWKFFLVPEDKFEQIKKLAEELDSYRNRELSEEEAERKESLINIIDEKASGIAHKTYTYKDDSENKDGTITEELVYRMDEAPEVRYYTDPDEFYFKFLVYITPDGLQKQYDSILKIFNTIESRDLLKREFLGKWEFLDRAREIFQYIKTMYKDAYENNCGVIKIDKIEWLYDDNNEAEEEANIEVETETESQEELETETVESDVVDA